MWWKSQNTGRKVGDSVIEGEGCPQIDPWVLHNQNITEWGKGLGVASPEKVVKYLKKSFPVEKLVPPSPLFQS